MESSRHFSEPVVVLALLGVLASCALATTSDQSESQPLTTGALVIGGVSTPIDAVRVSGSTLALTALPLSTQNLEIDMGTRPPVTTGTWSVFLGDGVYDLGNAQLVETTLPELATAPTAASKTKAHYVTIKFSPEKVRYAKATGSAGTPRRYVSANATFGAATSPASAVLAPVTIPASGQGVIVSVTMNESDAAAWMAWSPLEARNGQLRYLTDVGETRVNATGARITKKTKTKPAADAVAKVTAEMYVEQMAWQDTK
jgi:type II secretory pathway pseudopilin PulG